MDRDRSGGGCPDILDRPLGLHPLVRMRPERFGGLAYHFGTRRLTLIKHAGLAAVLGRLDREPDARRACSAAGVAPDELGAVKSALLGLLASEMVIERSGAPAVTAPKTAASGRAAR